MVNECLSLRVHREDVPHNNHQILPETSQRWGEERDFKLTLRERMAFGGQSWQSLSEVRTSASPKVSNCSPMPRRVKVR